MKFSDAMKALENGEVVKRPGKRSYYAARSGRFRRWILFEPGNAVEISATFVRQDVEADDWAIVANPPTAIADALASGAGAKENERSKNDEGTEKD